MTKSANPGNGIQHFQDLILAQVSKTAPILADTG